MTFNCYYRPRSTKRITGERDDDSEPLGVESGLETIETDPELRSPPVAVLSSSKAEDDVRETDALGANGYVVKPVDPNEFIATVRTVVDSLADSGRLPTGKFADVDHTT